MLANDIVSDLSQPLQALPRGRSGPAACSTCTMSFFKFVLEVLNRNAGGAGAKKWASERWLHTTETEGPAAAISTIFAPCCATEMASFLAFAGGPGAKKWASERWAHTTEMEGSSSGRAATAMLEAVPRSVSAPMNALASALKPK